MAHVNLERADLRHANLSGCDLSYVDLAEARLERTNLSHANLEGADLSGANLTTCDVRGANLRGARLDGATTGGMEYNSTTVWPEGIDPTELGATRLESGYWAWPNPIPDHDEDEYTDVALLTNHYANRLTFLGDEIKNDALQGMLSDGAASIRDRLIAVANAYYGQHGWGCQQPLLATRMVSGRTRRPGIIPTKTPIMRTP
jgi:uncharacterized protein YjbI with pentapeptide repeats